MNILITDATSPLAQTITTDLAPDHHLRLLDTTHPNTLPENTEFIQASPTDTDTDTVWKAVRDIDALILTGEPPPNQSNTPLEHQETLLDQAIRGTHILCQAAVDAGVKRFVYGSTLEIFSSYPDTVYISELHKPLPTPETYQMVRYLGELTCREFARENRITATALRLGKLVREEDVADQKQDPMWLDLRDAAQAFRLALQRDDSSSIKWQGRWNIYHICASLANPKFLIDQAHSMGYQPQHNFQGNIFS